MAQRCRLKLPGRIQTAFEKGLEHGSKPFVLWMDYWFLRMISSSWGIGL
ncbi:hypothetical protein [Neisseria uirgultaei]|nr:hypothetical protein [Neisseria uirgultaei]